MCDSEIYTKLKIQYIEVIYMTWLLPHTLGCVHDVKMTQLTGGWKVEIMLGIFNNSVNLRGRQVEGEKKGF